MFNRRRLPPDNYPDEFDTSAYRRYTPRLKPGLWLTLRENFGQVWLWLFFVGAIIVSFGITWTLLPPPEPVTVIITAPAPQAQAIDPGGIGGDFPAQVVQQRILIPARVDDALALGEKDGYRFDADLGTTWVISVYGDANLNPLLTLYNSEGLVVEINDDRLQNDFDSRIIFQAPQAGQYGIVVESAASGATAGGYTLEILPQR